MAPCSWFCWVDLIAFFLYKMDTQRSSQLNSSCFLLSEPAVLELQTYWMTNVSHSFRNWISPRSFSESWSQKGLRNKQVQELLAASWLERAWEGFSWWAIWRRLSQAMHLWEKAFSFTPEMAWVCTTLKSWFSSNRRDRLTVESRPSVCRH